MYTNIHVHEYTCTQIYMYTNIHVLVVYLIMDITFYLFLLLKEKAKEEKQEEVRKRISNAYKSGIKTLDESFEQLQYKKEEGT